jgi:hypothetical protein
MFSVFLVQIVISSLVLLLSPPKSAPTRNEITTEHQLRVAVAGVARRRVHLALWRHGSGTAFPLISLFIH